MEQKKNFLGLEKHNVIVFILALVSCCFSSFGFINAFELLGGGTENFGRFLLLFVYGVFRIAPSVLLLIYFLLFNNKKVDLLIPAVFAAYLLNYFSYFLNGINTLFVIYNQFPGAYHSGLWSSLATSVYNLGLVLLFVLAVVGACLGTNKKIGKLFMLIPICVGFTHSLVSWVSYFSTITQTIIHGFDFQLSYVTTPFIKVGFEALFIGLFIFVLKNPVSPLCGNKQQHPIAETSGIEE